jgi:hypothetical protein
VQLKDATMSEVKGGAKAMQEAAEKEYKSKTRDMTTDFAVSPHNMSLSLPDLSDCTGWRTEWNPHVFHLTANIIEDIKSGMKDSASQDIGVQALLAKIKKERD